MANSGISGRFCAVKIGATPTVVAGVQNWTCEDSVDRLDATTAADGGYKRPQAGLQGATGSFLAVIDVTGGSLTSLQAGTVITDLALFADTNSTNPIYEFPSALILKSTPRGEVNGRFTYDISFESVGSYTLNQPN